MTPLETTIWGTASLGSVIAALEAAEPETDVHFDFCYLAPTTVASYRGYYEHLALGWTDSHPGGGWPKVSELLTVLRGAVGKTFEGWKGGNYIMSPDTPIWVANRGETGGTGIVGIQSEGHTVVLCTAKVD